MSQPSGSISGGSWGLSWSPLLIKIALLGLMRINTHLFHNVVNIMFTLIAVLGRMVKSSTQTTWWAILFRLLVMCVILILICSSIILEILPAKATSSKLLRSSTPASASICIHLIPLKVRLACATILCTILLWCASLIAVILKLTLTILRSLSSISWYKSSKLSVSALRHYVRCHNPLILSVGAHGGCHGPHY